MAISNKDSNLFKERARSSEQGLVGNATSMEIAQHSARYASKR